MFAVVYQIAGCAGKVQVLHGDQGRQTRSARDQESDGMLKKPLVVLTGDSAEVDRRHLEMVKPGTLYLVLPPPAADRAAACPCTIENEEEE